jgi:hypothetical protein
VIGVEWLVGLLALAAGAGVGVWVAQKWTLPWALRLYYRRKGVPPAEM